VKHRNSTLHMVVRLCVTWRLSNSDHCGHDRYVSVDHWWNTATLSTINPTGNSLGSNCGLRAHRPKTNRLSHGNASVVYAEVVGTLSKQV